jgi:GH15 family glucan-1,4-alpha-glucosidase
MEHWREPDEGIWETRGGRQHFVFSKVMCWVALDRAIKAARDVGLPGDVERWREVRKEIRDDVMARGFDEERGAFVQHYGSKSLDASNLMLPLVGFIKATDPRMRATIEATERELTADDGFVYRYRDFDDGLAGTEGTFLICTFWLADNLILLGETDRARALFDRCRACANDLGLFSEEYDSVSGEMLGNFPQAFSHMGFINTAVQLARAEGLAAK